jgi:hypothetical protein
MIEDVLESAGSQIKHYLLQEGLVSDPAMLKRISSLLDEMESVRRALAPKYVFARRAF